MSSPEQAPGPDWDEFEALVAAHKMAVARVMRVEDLLIALMRDHNGRPPPDIAARHRAALDEARNRVWATSAALFPPEDSTGLWAGQLRETIAAPSSGTGADGAQAQSTSAAAPAGDRT